VLFNSYGFLCLFLPLTLAGLAATARLSGDAARTWLILCSLVFYGWWSPVFVPMLLGSVAGNFAMCRLIQRLDTDSRARTWVLTGGIGANLAALIWCKYLADWLAGLDGWFGTGLVMDNPLVPLGISFFTFTQIGALLDCAAGIEGRRSLLDYTLFVTFFPALIAGPIQTSRDTMRQIAERQRWHPCAEDIAVGSGVFVIGLLKKTMLADPLAGTVAAGFADPNGLSLLAAWQVALSYSMQLYFDFSGYSDMAIGAARLCGLRYPLNFASPYKARSVIDYWQRWHISLTRFFMTTVHAPLTMAVMRRRRAHGLRLDRTAQREVGGFASMILLPIGVTMVLAGIWHGSTLTFLVFGLLHAGFLAVNHAWRIYRPNREAPDLAIRIGRVALTYGCVLLASVVFRAPSMEAALSVLSGMVGLHGWAAPDTAPRTLQEAATLAGLYGLVWFAPNTQQIMTAGGSGWWCWRPSVPWAIACGCATTLGLLSLGGTTEFLYFRF
jgi:D-alanyl-lipoteichoic acid acyltransferase DltB (MBOAT superfamily)